MHFLRKYTNEINMPMEKGSYSRILIYTSIFQQCKQITLRIAEMLTSKRRQQLLLDWTTFKMYGLYNEFIPWYFFLKNDIGGLKDLQVT